MKETVIEYLCSLTLNLSWSLIDADGQRSGDATLSALLCPLTSCWKKVEEQLETGFKKYYYTAIVIKKKFEYGEKLFEP